MSNELAKPQDTLKAFFDKDGVKKKFEDMLGKRSVQFITSVLQIANNNTLLSKSDPISIYNAAASAATLDLPLNNNLGFAWIVPYGGKAQFQIGWKGFVQLAMRTGQYKKINVVEVYENQFISWNSLTEELKADFEKEGTGKVVGYCAYFIMVNGFEKIVYWSADKVKAHGKRYSKTFGNGVWKDEFDKMAKKTVLKNMLSQWGYLSVELMNAIKVDQSVVKSDNIEETEVEYVDATAEVDKEQERIQLMLNRCFTTQEVEVLADSLDDTDKAKYNEIINARKTELAK